MASPDLGLLLPALGDFVASTEAALGPLGPALGDFVLSTKATLGLFFLAFGDFCLLLVLPWDSCFQPWEIMRRQLKVPSLLLFPSCGDFTASINAAFRL